MDVDLVTPLSLSLRPLALSEHFWIPRLSLTTYQSNKPSKSGALRIWLESTVFIIVPIQPVRASNDNILGNAGGWLLSFKQH
jgi:hypothetical protein